MTLTMRGMLPSPDQHVLPDLERAAAWMGASTESAGVAEWRLIDALARVSNDVALHCCCKRNKSCHRSKAAATHVQVTAQAMCEQWCHTVLLLVMKHLADGLPLLALPAAAS